MANSNATKPRKPHRDFPLFPHNNGQWARKLHGKLYYFGVWADPDAAAKLWADQKDDLIAGRKPRVSSEGVVTVRDAVNGFLTAKQRKVEAGEMQRRMWLEYHETCNHIIKVFGAMRAVDDLRSDDFGQLRAYFARTRGAEALSNQVRRTRSLFKFAYDSDQIDRPMKFGPEFRAPDKRAKRRAKQSKPARLFTAAEIRALLDVASVPMRAMIMLGVGNGFGNSDCSSLPQSALDLKRGVIDYPRPKTAIERRAILWPETVKALREAIASRPEPHDPADAGLVFITRHGQPWVKFRETGNINSVSGEFAKLTRELKIDRDGVGFYALRHVFETVASETGDQAAVDRVMGHVSPGMGENYRHWLKDKAEDVRLHRIADHVREWLFSSQRRARKPATRNSSQQLSTGER